MRREFYLELANRGIRMPIATDLVLHESAEPGNVRLDGAALGRVIEQAAMRWGTPLAIPLMDLRLEKIDLLAAAGIPVDEEDGYRFQTQLDEDNLNRLCGEHSVCYSQGSVARDEALTYISSRPDLVPVGMTIGPYSLATRLMADPISATAAAGSGTTVDDSPEVRLLFQCLRMAEAAIERSVRRQIAHGATAIMVCEPAGCTAFISPRQMKAGSKIFDRVVIEPNLRIRRTLCNLGCDLIFHDCGELTDTMVQAFAQRLHPVILSLGSSRRLWQDARLVPSDVVLYGNLPTRCFYSDGAMPVIEVIRLTEELVRNMRTCGHPYLLGSECDVLFVPEARHAIEAKIQAMMHAGLGSEMDEASQRCSQLAG